MSLPERLAGLTGLLVLGWLAQFAANPADLIAVAAVLATAVLAMAVASRLLLCPQPGAGHRLRVPAALRERIRRRSVPRLCDPDAPGRRRPRAPSAYLSAA
jgi:Family of unknown function (DUF6412)